MLFDSFFGGFDGFGFNFGSNQQGNREIPRGGTLTMDLQVTLEELYNGDFIEVRITFASKCLIYVNAYNVSNRIAIKQSILLTLLNLF